MQFIALIAIVALATGINAENCPQGGEIYARGLDDDAKRSVIEAHNNYRLDIANGRVTLQPRGINLLRMSFDEPLGEKARVVSDSCEMNHIIAEDDRWWWVGQNLFITWSSTLMDGQTWDAAVTSWFGEQPNFVYPNISNGVTGHYTQVVWHDSASVGCDFISYYDVTQPNFPYAKLYTCNYGPGGNIQGSAPYETGSSGCENLC